MKIKFHWNLIKQKKKWIAKYLIIINYYKYKELLLSILNLKNYHCK